MPIERPFKTYADFEHLRKVLMRETAGGPVPIIELFADPEIMSEVTGIEYPSDKAVEIFTQAGDAMDNPEMLELAIRLMDLSLEYSKAVGYDYVMMIPIVPLKQSGRSLAGDADDRRKNRAWMEEHEGVIKTRKDFDEYPWPSPEQVNIFPVEYIAPKMPQGMKVMLMCTGIFDDLMEMMGFQNMAIKSIDEPGLVEDVLERLTVLAERAVELGAAHPATGAVFYSSDMGFNSGTILSPAFMRRYVIPRLKRIADACHRHGKPFLLHSCGNVLSIMEDLIDVVGIDAKHSFEDKIRPVEEWYRQYHDRIAILGGVDVDLLSRGTPEQVRERTRRILETCAPGGGYCMGTGNSVANYIPINNYYAMLDATREWNEEHGYK
jgi:uroporphyrinogen decarboxylase